MISLVVGAVMEAPESGKRTSPAFVLRIFPADSQAFSVIQECSYVPGRMRD